MCIPTLSNWLMPRRQGLKNREFLRDSQITKTKTVMRLFILMIICTLISCKQEQKFINIKTLSGNIEKQNEVTTQFKDKYLEIGLTSINSGAAYIATKEIKRATLEDPTATQIVIVDEASKPMQFQSATEFLNYMSSFGYEMVDQKKHKYGADYTFKKD